MTPSRRMRMNAPPTSRERERAQSDAPTVGTAPKWSRDRQGASLSARTRTETLPDGRGSIRRACVAALLLAAAPALADEVARRGDQPPVRGDVRESSREALTVAPPAGDPVVIPAADVLSVEWTGEPPRLPLTRAAEGRGQLAVALEGYREAVAQFPSAKPLAKAELQFSRARTLGKLALNDPARRDEAVDALGRFVTDHPDHHRTDPALLLLADVRAAAGDDAAAREALGRVKQSPSPAYATAAEVAAARLDLAAGDADTALATFERVAADAEGAAALDARTGMAAALVRLGRNDEALAETDAVIAEADSSDAEIMANAYLRRGDALQAMGETKPAILAYLHVDVLYPGAGAAHAESLFRLAKLWAAAGYPGRAAEAAAKLKTEYPGGAWAARLSGG